VHAVQKGAPIMSMVCSFQERAGGLDHQEPMPDVVGPEGLVSLAESFRGVDHPGARHIAESRPIELRPVESNMFVDAGPEQVATNHVWMRAVDRLPDDPLLHAAVLAYSSDYTLLEPVLRRHGLVWSDPRLRVASLDHSMWFHRDARADEWLLYDQQSPSAVSGRGLSIGQIFGADGVLVATTAQEGMVRVMESCPGPCPRPSVVLAGAHTVRSTATSWPSRRTPWASTIGERPHEASTCSTSPENGTCCERPARFATTCTRPRLTTIQRASSSKRTEVARRSPDATSGWLRLTLISSR
jgi:hypothetical protein